MKNIAVFFGGVSCEHDVSVITGLLVKEGLNKLKYKVFPIYIHSDGTWFLIPPNYTALRLSKEFGPDKALKTVTFIPGEPNLYEIKGKKLKIIGSIDCAVLCNHGLNGEDGSLAGLLQLCNIPSTSGGIFSAACSMDKVMMKEMFKALKLKQFAYMFFNKQEYKENSQQILKAAQKKFEFPVIIKPANLGSSIGISVCHNLEELKTGIETALMFDRKILIEKAAVNFIELNCSAISSKNKILSSSVEQPVSYREFLNFDDKYLSGKKGGIETCKRKLPAEIDAAVSEEIKMITRNIYKGFDCKGVIRVDYILENNTIYVNEINTIPGSLAYYLWEYDGITFKALLDILIEEAIEDFNNFKSCKFAFESDILSAGGGIKK